MVFLQTLHRWLLIYAILLFVLLLVFAILHFFRQDIIFQTQTMMRGIVIQGEQSDWNQDTQKRSDQATVSLTIVTAPDQWLITDMPPSTLQWPYLINNSQAIQGIPDDSSHNASTITTNNNLDANMKSDSVQLWETTKNSSDATVSEKKKLSFRQRLSSLNIFK